MADVVLVMAKVGLRMADVVLVMARVGLVMAKVELMMAEVGAVRQASSGHSRILGLSATIDC